MKLIIYTQYEVKIYVS